MGRQDGGKVTIGGARPADRPGDGPIPDPSQQEIDLLRVISAVGCRIVAEGVCLVRSAVSAGDR